MAQNNFFDLIKYKLILILICLNSFYISSQKLISSKLEIYYIYNEKRKVVLEEKNHLEAPNWLNENELIYNSNGLIYRYNFKTKQKTKDNMDLIGFFIQTTISADDTSAAEMI